MADLPSVAAAEIDGAQSLRRISPLRQYLAVLRRRRIVIAVTIAACVLAAFAYDLHKGKLYAASAQVVINTQDIGSALLGTPDLAAGSSDFATVLQTQADIARSPSVAQQVARMLPATGLNYDDVLGQTSVTPTPNADILIFSATGTTPELPIELVNAYARAFVAYGVTLSSATLNVALRQISTRISQARSQGNASLVTQLVGKQQELQELQTLETADASLIGPALTSSQTSPKPKKYFELALVGGVLIALALAWMLEALDTRARSAYAIEARLGIPMLGQIPSPAYRFHRSLVMLRAPHSTGADAFRLLQGNLQFRLLDLRVRTLMITSARSGEGKSMTVANLAIAAARAGSSVVLVDLDLRRPALRRLFSLPDRPGVTDVVSGRANLEDASCRVDLSTRSAQTNQAGPPTTRGTLRVIQSGAPPSDPGEFVVMPALARLLDFVATQADIVFIDAPPLLSPSEGMALARIVDGVLVVARIPIVTGPLIDRMRRALAGTRAATLGFVLTGSRQSDADGGRIGVEGLYGGLFVDGEEGDSVESASLKGR